MLSVTAITGALLASNQSLATSKTVGASVIVSEACTMTSINDSPHTATISPNTYSGASGSDYENGIGKTTLAVVCNDSNGFAIYAIGYTGDSYDSANHTKLVGTNTNLAIDTAVYDNSDTTSSWSMKVNKITDSTVSYNPQNMSILNSFDSWHAVPASYTKVAQYHASTGSSTTDSTLGAKVTTTYAAYIAQNQPADTYIGQVKYTMVHPYNASAPVIPGACNPQGTTIGTNTSTDIVCMQDISSTNKLSILTSMTNEQQYTLIDQRDHKTYTVSKLADGNIWMTQDLDLDLDSTKTYTNEDTDLGWNTSTESYDTANWTPERSTYATGTTTWGLYNQTTGNRDGSNHPESYDPGDLYWNGTLSDETDWETYYNSCTFNGATRLAENCDETLNPIATYTTVSGTPTPQYHLGNFYNWSAAIASNDSSSIMSGIVNQSICPSGWTLPIGRYYELPTTAPDKSFQYLIEEYGWNYNDGTLSNNRKAWEIPIYFSLSGYWYGILGGVGYETSPWASVPHGSENAYNLEVYASDYIDPSFGALRDNGATVRCIARY
ncbi:hypothetical protein IJG22_00215 [Candidatus Saccharibacteria bacterium]|nr:hypothetical protein [Candidatus Saccharibacteria bacterium]